MTLVQASRSAAPVSVALQLPQSASTTPNARLVDRFPSSTSLWQILRRFESGVAGGASTAGKNFNFTQRATPHMVDGSNPHIDGVSGAGRLCYEMPTLNIMGRQLETVSDLSRTFQQLGLSGNVMLRLGFKNTMQPLEEAMAEISKYFDDIAKPPVFEEQATSEEAEPSSTAPEAMDTSEGARQTTERVAEETTFPGHSAAAEPETPESEQLELDSSHQSRSIRNISVFSPPSSSTPAAASLQAPHNEADYIPTQEHARSHQANLARASRNKRLLTEAQTERQRQERDAQLSQVTHVTVRLRFPDQSSVQKEYGQLDMLNTLYETCRAVLHRPTDEQFELHAGDISGGAVQGSGVGAIVSLPDNEQKLIRDLGWTGRILVTVGWGQEVSKERRAQPSLKPEFRALAEEFKVNQPFEGSRGAGQTLGGTGDGGGVNEQGGGEDSKAKKAGDKEARLKKLLGFKK